MAGGGGTRFQHGGTVFLYTIGIMYRPDEADVTVPGKPLYDESIYLMNESPTMHKTAIPPAE